MSYTAIVGGLHTTLAGIAGLTVLDYAPRSVQTTPLIYSILDNGVFDDAGDAQSGGTLPHYRIQSRLMLSWQDNEQCELQLAGLVDDIKAAVDADPTLGGAIGDGQARIVSLDAGWIGSEGGTITHRFCDFFIEVWEV